MTYHIVCFKVITNVSVALIRSRIQAKKKLKKDSKPSMR
jgi:hypothetical protein